MIFHVYDADRYLGTVAAETEEQAEKTARSRWQTGVTVVPVQYREKRLEESSEIICALVDHDGG